MGVVRLLQREVFPKYREYSQQLANVYRLMSSSFAKDSVETLCKIRGYPLGESSQHEYLKDNPLGYFEVSDVYPFREFPKELGLFSKNGELLLNGRYIIPVTSVGGDLVSLIGYFDDFKRYITLSTPFFSKSAMFFRYNEAYKLSWGSYNGVVFLVEGIFDCISLWSLGLPCIATMGSSVSAIKGDLLKVFRKVIAIPDDDETGRKALNRYAKTGWKVPSNTVMVEFHGGVAEIGGASLPCKDMDNFVTWYEADDVREMLLSFVDSREEIDELILI